MVTPGYLAFHPNPKKPDHMLPPDACDVHCHVFGPAARFPFASTSTYVPVDAPKETLFQRHRHLGVSRAVIVQASCHGTDNTAMLDALRAGGDDYRGAAELGLSEFGVRYHLRKLFAKLGARNRAEAARLARQMGLVPADP